MVNDPQYGRLNNASKIMELQAEKARAQNYLSKINIEMDKQLKIQEKEVGGKGSIFSSHRFNEIKTV